MYLNKVDASTGETMSGFTYAVTRKINGQDNANSYNVTPEGGHSSKIDNEVNIDRSYLNTPDEYTFKEDLENAVSKLFWI